MNEPGPELVEGATLLEERDYVDAQLAYAGARRHVRSIRQLIAIVGIVSGAAIAFHWPVAPGVWIPMLVSLVVGAAVLPRQYVSLGRRAYAALDPGRREVRYQLDMDGLRTVTPKSEIWASWQSYDGWLESDAAFLLQVHQVPHDYLPKRAFDEASIAAVRALLASRIQVAVATPATRTPADARKTLVLWVLLIALFTAVYYYLQAGH